VTLKPVGPVSAASSVVLSRPLTGVVPADGSTSTVSISRPGQIARYTFTGTAGQGFTLQANAGSTFTTSPVALAVYQPSGATIASGSVAKSSSTKLDLGVLPTTGTYTVVLTPAGIDTGAIDLRVIPEDTSALVVDAPPRTIALGTAQNGRYTFTANAGDSIAVGVMASSTTPAGASVDWKIWKPDGTALANNTFTGNGSWRLPQIPTTGTYTVTLKPVGPVSATSSVVLSRPLTGVLPTDGSTTTVSNFPGQTFRYTFTGTAGQGFTLQASTASNFTFPVDVKVYQPSGATVASGSLAKGYSLKLDLGVLPSTGTYTVVLTPVVVQNGIDAGVIDLRVVPEDMGALVVNDAAKTIALGTAQNGRYTFTADAGDYLTLALTSYSTTPAGGGVTWAVLKPDGTTLGSFSFTGSQNWNLPTIPTTGTYTVTVKPSGAISATSAVLLSRAVTGVLLTDGTASNVSLSRPGQAALYTFSASAGQGFTFLANPPLTYGVWIAVYSPTGASVASGNVGSGSPLKLDLGVLAATGTYTVSLSQGGGLGTGTTTLRLIPEDTGALVVGDAVRTFPLGTAQDGRYTFTGSAGALLNLVCSAFSSTPTGSSVTIAILKPDGTTLGSKVFTGAATYQVPQLPSTGTYSITVKPAGTASATLGLQLATR
jgi:hypothetical protein